MAMKSIKLIVITLSIIGIATFILPVYRPSKGSEGDLTSSGFGDAKTLISKYEQWESEYIQNHGEGNLILPLTSSSTFSTEPSDAGGEARIDLIRGDAEIRIKGLARSETWDAWIVDNLPGENLSVLPEAGDKMIKLGSLSWEGEDAKLRTTLEREILRTIDPDLVVITRAGKSPAENRVLSGNLTLFQELYLSKVQGHFGQLNDADRQKVEEKGFLARLADNLGLSARAQDDNSTAEAERLIARGRKIFLNETFQGNGRTCATCHREEENFTISPEFIATLPIQDPLFVAEIQPALSRNFENPYLMRTKALILENVDGFDDLENKFVFRSPQHTLAMLPNTLNRRVLPLPTDPSRAVDGACIDAYAPVERVGWSGDGGPVDTFKLSDGSTHVAMGTLRDFTIRAIIQHFPRTLARRPRTSPDQSLNSFDFRLPTQDELNAVEAFQKSLGRREDPDLSLLKLKGETPASGQGFFNIFRCSACHENAGAGEDIPGIEENRNANTGIENIRPTYQNGAPIPADGGFGERPDGACGPPQPGPCPDGGCGNGTFNVQVLVEAADTGPFFHNNAFDTIEGAVSFYNSATFNSSPGRNISGPISMSTEQVTAIAAFLRILNTLENIRSAGELEKRAKLVNPHQGKELIRLALSELKDAMEVLSGGNLHSEARAKLSQAMTLNWVALNARNPRERNELLDQSLALMHTAVDDMVEVNVSAFNF